jgi:putative aldouronate transport system permease protein
LRKDDEAMKSKGRTLPSTVLVYFCICLFVLFCVLPFILVISASFSGDAALREYGPGLLPREPSLEAYQYAFKYPEEVMRAYGVTIFVTVVGTVLNLALTILIAYPLSKRTFRYRRPLSFYLFFTMLFNGGLVPTYLLIKNYLHLYDTIWVLILPLLIVPGNVFILRVFFQGIPESLYESAVIDGAGEWTMLFRVAIPLSKAGIATVTVFIVLLYWNDAFSGLLYLENPDLTPLQLKVTQFMNYVQNVKQSEVASGGLISSATMPSRSLLFALCVIAIGPMMFVFAFFQKHFVRGLTAGAIKE